MFGVFGSIIYGIAYVIGWSQDERIEQHTRQDSRNKNIDYYYDKRGRRRWTTTGKKQTPQEILKNLETIQEKREAEKRDAMEQYCLDSFRKKYDLYIIHKDRISFEEYVAFLMSPNHLKYKIFREIKNNVSEERLREIRSNQAYYL